MKLKIIFLLFFCVVASQVFGQGQIIYRKGKLTDSAVTIGVTAIRIKSLDSTGEASGQVLTSQGAGHPPHWTTSPGSNPMTTLGDEIYGGASGAATRLAGNTTSTKKFLTQTGNGSISAAPGWNAIAYTDLTNAVQTNTLSADTATTSTTLIGTPLQFTIGASEVWEFDANLATGSGDASGIKIGVDVPASATQLSQCFGSTSGVTANSFDDITTDATAGIAFNTANNQTGHIWIHGKVTNSTNAGSVIIDFEKVTASTATLRNGSWIRAWRVQ